jgi:SUMO ligase MMS21 Smc5/6 complex component
MKKKKKVSKFNTKNRSTQRSWVSGIFLSFCCDISCKPATIPGIKFKKNNEYLSDDVVQGKHICITKNVSPIEKCPRNLVCNGNSYFSILNKLIHIHVINQ